MVVVVLLALASWRVAWTNVDRDADGISDCRERYGLRSTTGTSTWHTSGSEADTDEDGVDDGEEAGLLVAGRGWRGWFGFMGSCTNQTYAAVSDPGRADTDGDELEDAVELSDGSSPFAADSDDDGLSDSDERDWGSDANVADTDGDGAQDGTDVEGASTPVTADETADDEGWSREYAEGVVFGDFKEIDSVPQLLGSVSGGASSSVPVIGLFSGTGADLRDVAANIVHRDWGSAGASGAGLLPYAGDATRTTKLVTQFVEKHPDSVVRLVELLAAWERIPLSLRVRLLGVADPSAVDGLRVHELSDQAIVELARRGTRLASLVHVLDRVGGRVVHGASDSDGDEPEFADSSDEAVSALRRYAQSVDDPAQVSTHAVYIGGLPDAAHAGGRLVDVCTACAPAPEKHTSVLRMAKLSSLRYSDTVQDQIDKDSWLREQGYQVEWHFFMDRTATAVDPALLDALDEVGISSYVHLPT